ncbi:chorismate mutase [Bartonella sp. TP]|uniref:chorismate mutase n=1 Tax=Bartonella sp. TP TaxID=3057550 RepID=UPI0025AFF1F3|nr:chorismate mutase [Bartonella sp. TP]MDN5248544.1 chorismate mutase [Alphaproteobacteria bacterium]WJW79535.1 chorismate mutase [Bartonella sp. TP]
MDKNNKLLDLRESINDLDAALIHILAQRFRIIRDIAILKRQEGRPVLDEARQKTHIASLQQTGADRKLDKDFINELFSLIMKRSVKEQEELL